MATPPTMTPRRGQVTTKLASVFLLTLSPAVMAVYRAGFPVPMHEGMGSTTVS